VRDFVVVTHWRVEESGTIIVAAKSIPAATALGPAPQSSHVRAEVRK
jgi:hypothetical protein